MAAEIINEISEWLQKGRAKNVKALVEEALAQGLDPKEILNDGLLDGMMIVGGKFKRNEVFVPEVLVAARAMTAGLTVLEPKLVEVGNGPLGKAVIGTVKGDLHDIGKNLVAMMLKGAGFEITRQKGRGIICLQESCRLKSDRLTCFIRLTAAKTVIFTKKFWRNIRR